MGGGSRLRRRGSARRAGSGAAPEAAYQVVDELREAFGRDSGAHRAVVGPGRAKVSARRVIAVAQKFAPSAQMRARPLPGGSRWHASSLSTTTTPCAKA